MMIFWIIAKFHFTGDIYAIPEGTIIFPREPLLKVVAPIMEAQLVETAILNILNHQSLIATKQPESAMQQKVTALWNLVFAVHRDRMPESYGARAAVIGGVSELPMSSPDSFLMFLSKVPTRIAGS